ncbi:MAG: hypothetical protein KBT10_09420 [Bacteroidales bacterium]|nr:hypothetical protein [Candidatus Sodaliphilus aphodohippi]
MRQLTLIAAVCLIATNSRADFNETLNAQAEAEYTVPVRPGSEDGTVPFWNGHAWRYMYAPVYDFKPVKGAKSYRHTVMSKDSTFKADFIAGKPSAALTPIWNQVPVGDCKYTVEALDKKGKTIKVAGEDVFVKEFPFHGPYREKLYSYDECIKRALNYVHYLPAVRHWDTHDTPDMNYPFNSYLCKIIGSTIRHEVLYAQYYPAEKDAVVKRCRNIAKFIMSQAQPADAPLAYFPPTYYGSNLAAGFPQNQGKTMTMEPIEVVYGFLDLYKACGDRQYLDFVLHIMDTYKKIRRPDGSYPVKMDLKTGVPVNNAIVSPHAVYFAIERLENEFGIYDYKDLRLSIEQWAKENLCKTFDWNSQFEDIPLENYVPYQNPSNCIAAPWAMIFLRKDNPTKEELRYSEDITRFCEDQFVMWGTSKTNGVPDTNIPCAFEQIEWDEPTDASTSYLILCFALMYKHTGDPLWLAKANALAANITFVQSKISGMIPTVGWRFDEHITQDASQFWINCSAHTLYVLKEFCELTGEQ